MNQTTTEANHDAILSGLPVVIVLDCCLLKTDMLFEQVAATAKRQPLALLLAIGDVLRRRQTPNSRLVAESDLDIEVLPARQDVVNWVTDQKVCGREIVLLTAVNQEVAEAIAERFKIFSHVKNIERCSLASFLRQQFPNGFV